MLLRDDARTDGSAGTSGRATRRTGARLRGRRRLLVGAAATALGLTLLAAGKADHLADPVAVSFERAPRLAQLPEYGAHGSDVLGYDHGARVRFTLPVRNRGPLPVHVVGVDPLPEPLGLLAVEEVTLDGARSDDGWRLDPFAEAELAVTARFDHCEYYTERAVGRYPDARVTRRVLGIERTERVELTHDLLVRSPTIQGCPDRELDRSARQRGEDASIRG